jgi:hypothetical protein
MKRTREESQRNVYQFGRFSNDKPLFIGLMTRIIHWEFEISRDIGSWISHLYIRQALNNDAKQVMI